MGSRIQALAGDGVSAFLRCVSTCAASSSDGDALSRWRGRTVLRGWTDAFVRGRGKISPFPLPWQIGSRDGCVDAAGYEKEWGGEKGAIELRSLAGG